MIYTKDGYVIRIKKIDASKRSMNLTEAAEYCGMCRQTFKKAVDEGKVKHAKFGRRSRRFSKENLNDFLAGKLEENEVEDVERKI